MSRGAALGLAAVVVLVLVLLAAYGWYFFYGWTAFAFRGGETPRWAPPYPAGVSSLRFTDALFSVERGDGVSRVYDVSPALNAMAVAYRGARGSVAPAALRLVGPLNPFSFQIPGFNDRASAPDPSAPAWTSARVALAGKWRVL